MYSIEVERTMGLQLVEFHPKRFKQIVLRLYALQQDPRPPDGAILDAETCRVNVGPFRILYHVDDYARRIHVIAIRGQAEGE